MSVTIPTYLPTGYAARVVAPAGDVVGKLYAAQASTTSAPSGVAGAGTFAATGVGWVDLWLTAAVADVTITVWAYSAVAGGWHIDTAFGVGGSLTVDFSAAPAVRVSHQVLGADYMHVQVSALGSSATLTAFATSSQDVPK